MRTEFERLTTLFVETFPEFTLAASRATEWLDDFGYDACVKAIAIAKERNPTKPLGYIWKILSEGEKRSQQVKPVHGFDATLRERYSGYVESGDLTAEEMKLLISACSGGIVDRDAYLHAEYHLRRAVYPKSISWLPEGMTYWEKLAWSEKTDEQRHFFHLPELQIEAVECQAKWANSAEFEKMKGGNMEILNWAR